MEMLGTIRRMHLRDKVSLHEIAKRTGLSRNTVRSWLREPGEVQEPVYSRAPVFNKLSGFAAELERSLAADAQRAKQNRRTARALFTQIKASGYEGGYTRVTDFIRAWRSDAGKGVKAFVPLKFDLGEAFQFDWSEEGLVVGGIYHRMQVSHMKLCASRAFWLVAYPSQGHEMLFDAHTRSFAALGGVARRGIYDNMKTAVDKVKKGKGRIVNARFAVMCAHYLFDADFCNVASGWEKGVVEKNVQDSRRRIWIDAQTRKWHSFEELNAWLGERCRALWSEIRHPEYKAFSVAEMLEQERSELMPMPTAFDGYVERSAKVSSTCLVAVAKNRYSVPCELAGQRVSTRLYPSRVEVASDEAIVASHARVATRLADNIAAEVALDGLYVIRTSVTAQRMDAATCVRTYKSLAQVERAFRSIKTMDLKVRPIHHHLENRVRAHIFLCMLAYYVEWHMRQAWAELMFADEDQVAKLTRDPVAPAGRSDAAMKKVLSRTLEDGSLVPSFQTLMAQLQTIVRNTCCTPKGAGDVPMFEISTTPSDKQKRALELIAQIKL